MKHWLGARREVGHHAFTTFYVKGLINFLPALSSVSPSPVSLGGNLEMTTVKCPYGCMLEVTPSLLEEHALGCPAKYERDLEQRVLALEVRVAALEAENKKLGSQLAVNMDLAQALAANMEIVKVLQANIREIMK